MRLVALGASSTAVTAVVFLVLAGATNGVNLTDGLDGLAAGCGAIVLLTYTAMTFITGGQGLLDPMLDVVVLLALYLLWDARKPIAALLKQP